MIDLTQAMAALVVLTIVLLATVIIPYMKQKISAEKLAELQKWAKIAVYAAEMLFPGSGRGLEKKEYALQFLQSMGFTVDIGKLDAMIEAAVLALKQAV